MHTVTDIDMYSYHPIAIAIYSAASAVDVYTRKDDAQIICIITTRAQASASKAATEHTQRGRGWPLHDSVITSIV